MDKPKMKHELAGDLTSKIIITSDMVSYQEGSVVSREVISRKSGTVTIFAFDTGQGLSEHTAPFDAMVYILDGAALVTIAGEEFNVETGEMIIMPANIPHALIAESKFKMLLTLIRDQVVAVI